MSSLLIKNIRHLITCDSRDRVLEHVNLYAVNGEIRCIGQEAPAADEILDAAGMAAYPGLINSHHHLYQYFTRNIPQVQELELFPWLKALYTIWQYINEDTVYYSSLAGMGELLKTGCTTCFDHHYVFPKGCGDLLGAQFKAAEKLGIRFHASRGSMCLSEKDGGLPPDSVVQSMEEILQSSEEAVKQYHDPRRFSMRQVALAPCSPFSVTGDLMKETARLARRLHVRLHTHLAETKDEETYVTEKYGMRPLKYMESLEWLGPDVWFAHGIHFNENELLTLAETGTGIAHCPVSNMKLSSGVARIPEMLRAGVPVGLAVDGSASNDGSSLLEEMRVCYLLHRLHSSRNALSGYTVLKMATTGSARLLGRDDIGSLQPGMAADLFLIRENRPEWTGAMLDPGAALATIGYRGSVDTTIVNGRVVVRDGRLVSCDEESLAKKAEIEVARLLKAAKFGSPSIYS